MRGIFAMGGGLALGILASRLAPPLIAQAAGSVRARMGEDPFERLIQDHRKIQSVLEEMERTPEGSPARRMTLFLTLKRTLAKHALAEEDIVYPQLLSQAQESGRTKHLYDEHADIKIHLYELEQLLTRNENWADRVRSLRALIEPHIRQEEDEEFPKLRQTLDERGTRTLAKNIRREEALVL